MSRLLALLTTSVFIVFFGTGQLFCVCESDDYCGGIQNVFAFKTVENATFHHEQHGSLIVNQDCCKSCHSDDVTSSSTYSSGSQAEQLASCGYKDARNVSLTAFIYQQHLGRSPPHSGPFVINKIFLAKGSLLV